MGKKMEFIYGRNAVTEALKSSRPGARVARLYLAEGVETKEGGPVDTILKLAGGPGRNIPLKKTSRQELDKLTGAANHQGVVAEVPEYAYTPFKELLEEARENENALFLVLDYLQDPQNLGTLLRSAEAAGVSGVILPERRAAGVTPAVRNASSGAVEHLKIAQVVNLPRALDDLKELGVWVAGLEDEPKALPFTKASYTGKLALVVGSEGPGLGRLVRERCDYFVILPMMGKIASLNAAVAGSIALYEVLRQRQNSP